VSYGTAGGSRRKVGTTWGRYGPYALGCTRVTMAVTKGCELVRGS